MSKNAKHGACLAGLAKVQVMPHRDVEKIVGLGRGRH